jgi:hypothetical protein
MKFTVTSGAGVPKSSTVLKARKLPSSTSSGYLGASETTFASLMRTWRRTPADLCRLAAYEVAMLPDESGLSF